MGASLPTTKDEVKVRLSVIFTLQSSSATGSLVIVGAQTLALNKKLLFLTEHIGMAAGWA